MDLDDLRHAGVTFAVTDISSLVTCDCFHDHTKDAAAAALEGTVGFAADGLGDTNTPDNVDISAGFIKDLTGNATTDAAADTAPIIRTYKANSYQFFINDC